MFGIQEKRICEGTQFETLQLTSPDFPQTRILTVFDGNTYNVLYDSTSTHLTLASFDEKGKAEEDARKAAEQIFATTSSPLKIAKSLYKVEATSDVS